MSSGTRPRLACYKNTSDSISMGGDVTLTFRALNSSAANGDIGLLIMPVGRKQDLSLATGADLPKEISTTLDE